MKTTMPKTLCMWFAALVFVLISPIAAAQSFTIDTSNTSTSPMTGLWNNVNEAGWGTAIIQQYGMMFVTMYTYDGSGNPVWYVASNCPVTANQCTGPLYKVTGGSSPTVPWNGTNKVVTPVGTLTLTFLDLNTGTMTFTIDGASGAKAIARDVFAAPAVSATCNSSNFTTARYNAISLGMTLDQVNQIIGCQSTSSQASSSWKAYAWLSASPTVQTILVYFDASGSIVTSLVSIPGLTPIFKYSTGF